VESAGGGRGNDQLFGDAQNNALLGGSGADVIYGRIGHDTVFGGDGDDRVFGDDGNDDVRGDTGADAVSGGAGDDFLDGARESYFVSDKWYEDPSADVLTCDAGADVARTNRLDTVTAECETMTMDIVDRLGAVPTIDADSADFALGCDSLAGCVGTISLSGPDGQPYGEEVFAIPEDAPADAVVAVPLNAVARTALQAGTLVQVDVTPKDPGWEPGGYRIFLRAGLLAPG
jgi:Ca2+-binding RTX toxin-like protein